MTQVAEERALAGRCGEPCCPRPLRAPRGRGFRLDAARQRVAREADVLFCRRGARGARAPCRRSRRLCAVGAAEVELVEWPPHVRRCPLSGRGAPCCLQPVARVGCGPTPRNGVGSDECELRARRLAARLGAPDAALARFGAAAQQRARAAGAAGAPARAAPAPKFAAGREGAPVMLAQVQARARRARERP